MNRGSIFRIVTFLFCIVMVASLVVVTGCSKKPPIQVEPEPVDTGQTTETIPPPPVVEQPEDTGPKPLDYASLDPAEYGVEDVFFGFDRYDLDDAAMAALARNARILRDAGVAVMISGHCDERGTVEYNIALGERRAIAVRDYLASLGVDRGKMRITSYGENKPFAMGHNEAAWAQNRRAHFERP